jgi:hypothetical protein
MDSVKVRAEKVVETGICPDCGSSVLPKKVKELRKYEEWAKEGVSAEAEAYECEQEACGYALILEKDDSAA